MEADAAVRKYLQEKRLNLVRLYAALCIAFFLPLGILLIRPVATLWAALRTTVQLPPPLQSANLHVSILGAFALIALAGYWFLQWSKFSEQADAKGRALDLAVLPGCREFIDNTSRILGITEEVPAIIIARGLATATTSLGRPAIGLSPSFAQMYGADRDAARFVLAHEMSHIAQGDTRLLARLDWLALYTRQLLYWYLMINAGFVVLGVLFVGIILKQTDGAQAGEDYKDVVTAAGLQALVLIAGFLAARAGLLVIRKMRHRSEFLADQGAASVVDPRAFCAWLAGLPELGNSTHPALRERLRRIQAHAEHWPGDWPPVPEPPPPSAVPKRGFRSGLGWAMLTGALMAQKYVQLGVQSDPDSGTTMLLWPNVVGCLFVLGGVAIYANRFKSDGPQVPASYRARSLPLRLLAAMAAVAAVVSAPFAASAWRSLHPSRPVAMSFADIASGKAQEGEWVTLRGTKIALKAADGSVVPVMVAPDDPLYGQWAALRDRLSTLPKFAHEHFLDLDDNERAALAGLEDPQTLNRYNTTIADMNAFPPLVFGRPYVAFLSTASDPDPQPAMSDLQKQLDYDRAQLSPGNMDDMAALSVSGLSVQQATEAQQELHNCVQSSRAIADFSQMAAPATTVTGILAHVTQKEWKQAGAGGVSKPIAGLVDWKGPYPSPVPVLIVDVFAAATVTALLSLIALATSHRPALDDARRRGRS